MQVLRLWFPQLCNFTLTSATSPTLCSTLAVVFNSSLSSLYSLLLVKQVLITLVELRADLYTWKLLRNTFQGASDRNLITIGLVTMVVALIWLMCTLPSFSHHTPANLPFFVVGVAIDLAGKEGRDCFCSFTKKPPWMKLQASLLCVMLPLPSTQNCFPIGFKAPARSQGIFSSQVKLYDFLPLKFSN